MHRFFIDPHAITGNAVLLDSNIRHQIKDVLRLAAGGRIVVLDNSGMEYEVIVKEIGRETAHGEIVARRPSRAEPHIRIVLFQGLLKGAKFELVLQKGTELGVSVFVPVVFQRSLASGELSGGKSDRWQRIIVEAAEQSGRGRVPELSQPVAFSEACRRASGLRLLPWEDEMETGLRQTLERFEQPGPAVERQTVSIFIGPEGGITRDEVDLAVKAGIVPVSLGPRILRAETAPLAVVAAVLYHFRDFGTMPSPPLKKGD